MIYASNVLGAYVKKALGDKAFQTNATKIAETLPIDPQTSNMNAVVIGPKDVSGIKGKVLKAAIEKKHESVGIIYIYQKDKDEGLIDGDVEKVKVKRITPAIIEESINKVIELKAVGKDHRIVDSRDRVRHKLEQEKFDQPTTLLYDEQQLEVSKEDSELAQKEIANAEKEVATSSSEQIPAATVENEELVSNQVKEGTIEQRIKNLGQFADWDLFKRSYQTDTVLNELMEENIQYAGLVKMLDTLDTKIINVFKDTALSADSKFEEIKSLGLERSAYKDLQNNIIAEKVLSIMTSIVQSVEATVDYKVNTIRKALDSMAIKKVMYEDQRKLRALIDERLQIQVELHELAKNVIEVFKVLDSTAGDFLESLDDGLPSESQYINEVLKTQKNIFTPKNVTEITARIMRDLQSNRITMSVLEEKISNLIDLVFQLCETDGSIIEYQQKLINLLQAQRIEDVVIVDSIIKNCLRIFVGPQNVGRTSTSLIWAGTLSRRQNTVLIDLTGSSKYSQYGVTPISLDAFLSERIEQQFLVVEGNIDDLDHANELISELRTRLNYYPNINLVLDSHQTELLDQLSPSALSVHFITDCTPRGISQIKETIATFKRENIARKVILIDPPVDPMNILLDLEIDPLLIKLIVIPRLKYISASALKGTIPYNNAEVVEVFEQAFR
ncbi:hypothetical protein [Cytobacillus sp. IB215316]|uniref:hypothetical protein n=1 Tax=Cytobacillus sp. IB215316 TaxID=3097354 RepID=UPI002A178FF7|nr:hypothetical protein [Cytobacillus sp. IB215316]MDX8360780.1 hypothetical protein [Cytobacillus sp. IB215316]